MKKPRQRNTAFFDTSEEREEYMIKNAEYFTVVAFLGTGKYERHEAKTLAEATILADQLAHINHKTYMIYAVVPPYDSFVKSVKPKKEEVNGVSKSVPRGL